MKLVFIGAAIAAGTAVLYARSHRKQSRLTRAVRMMGRRMFVNLFKRAVKQGIQLRACTMRLHRMEDRLKTQPQ